VPHAALMLQQLDVMQELLPGRDSVQEGMLSTVAALGKHAAAQVCSSSVVPLLQVLSELAVLAADSPTLVCGAVASDDAAGAVPSCQQLRPTRSTQYQQRAGHRLDAAGTGCGPAGACAAPAQRGGPARTGLSSRGCCQCRQPTVIGLGRELFCAGRSCGVARCVLSGCAQWLCGCWLQRRRA
jgi:hypothetical protein